MLYDLVNQVLSVNGLAPQVLAATAQGSSKDFSNAKIATGAIIEVGTYGANSTQLGVQIEESTTGTGAWTAIPGMAVTNITAAGHYVVAGQRTHRYVRANAITVSGTTPSVAVSITIIGEKQYAGTNNSGYSRSPSS